MRHANSYKLILFASTLAVTASVVTLRCLNFFEKIELQTFDQMLVMRPEEKAEPKVVVVEVTEKYIQSVQHRNLGAKSISDSELSLLLNKLHSYQPLVIGIDIYRDFADPPDQSNPIQLDTELSKDNVVAVCKGKDSTYDSQGIKPPSSVPIERQGFSDAIKDLDNVVRRQILMMAQEPSSPCKTEYSLSLQLAARYLFNRGINLNVNEDYIQFGDRIFKALKPGRSGAYQQETDLNGIQIPINYSNTDLASVTLEDVLSDRIDFDLLKDKVVIIGVTANTISDTWSTPYTAAKENLQEIPGVFIQAEMVNQIVNAVLERRPIIWVLPFWGDIIWIYGWSFASTFIVWHLRQQYRVGGIFTTVVIVYGVCTFCLFKQGLWLPCVPSAVGVIASGWIVLSIQNSQKCSSTSQSLIK